MPPVTDYHLNSDIWDIVKKNLSTLLPSDSACLYRLLRTGSQCENKNYMRRVFLSFSTVTHAWRIVKDSRSMNTINNTAIGLSGVKAVTDLIRQFATQ